MADTPTTSRRPGRGYAPMAPEAWEARTTYLREARAKLLDPSAPEPSIDLLTVGPHGPFTAIWAEPSPDDKGLSVFFTVKNSARGPRWTPPEVFIMLDLLLAFGGGLSVNDNGFGWAYLRPWGGNDRHTLGRLVTDAKAGYVVRQNKQADHHDQHPQHFRVTPGPVRVDRPQKAPRRNRQDAIELALRYWDRNHHRSGITVTREGYAAILRDAFRLVDAYYSEDLTDDVAA